METTATMSYNLPGFMSVPHFNVELPKSFDTTRDDAIKFLNEYMEYTNLYNWTDELKIKYFPRILENMAKDWFNVCIKNKGVNEWDKIVDEFKVQFVREPYMHELNKKLISRKQEKNENILSYYYSLLNLCYEVKPDMENKDILDKFITTLLPHYMYKVLMEKPKDLEELLEFVHLLNDSETYFRNDILAKICKPENNYSDVENNFRRSYNGDFNQYRGNNRYQDYSKYKKNGYFQKRFQTHRNPYGNKQRGRFANNAVTFNNNRRYYKRNNYKNAHNFDFESNDNYVMHTVDNNNFENGNNYEYKHSSQIFERDSLNKVNDRELKEVDNFDKVEPEVEVDECIEERMDSSDIDDGRKNYTNNKKRNYRNRIRKQNKKRNAIVDSENVNSSIDSDAYDYGKIQICNEEIGEIDSVPNYILSFENIEIPIDETLDPRIQRLFVGKNDGHAGNERFNQPDKDFEFGLKNYTCEDKVKSTIRENKPDLNNFQTSLFNPDFDNDILDIKIYDDIDIKPNSERVCPLYVEGKIQDSNYFSMIVESCTDEKIIDTFLNEPNSEVIYAHLKNNSDTKLKLVKGQSIAMFVREKITKIKDKDDLDDSGYAGDYEKKDRILKFGLHKNETYIVDKNDHTLGKTYNYRKN